ncbi:MAG: pilus assembly protein N-terminal domain-containing protein [Candidatus Caenarcaniphilales bacterium]|nr:pilus assembly protein N-terminal domain-containing protein [Candidatus Caenarcaniphilales bacterium]
METYTQTPNSLGNRGISLLPTKTKIKKTRVSSNPFFAVLALLCLSSQTGMSETVFLKGTAYQSGISLKDIKVGSSEVVVSNAPIKRVAVTDPSVANIKVLSDTSALVMGRKVGKTTLLIWEGKDSSVRPTRFDISVKRDITDLIESLKTLDPNIAVDYIVVPSNRIEPVAQPPNSNGAYTTSYNVDPQVVGDPAPSVVVSNQNGTQAPPPPAAGGGGLSTPGGVVERVILSGKVKSPDVIAKAMTITATYMGEDSSMRIVTRNGGFIVDQINQLLAESDASGGAATGSQSLTRPLNFTSNLRGNLGNGSIVANSNGTIMSFLEVTDRPQISVMIRFYEVSRSVGKEFSTRFGWIPGKTGKGGVYGLGAGGNLPNVGGTFSATGAFGSLIAGTPVGASSNAGISIAPTAGSNPGTFFSLFPKQQLAIAVQALESRGEVKVLAEPNLVVQSGEPGKFLAGGEVPIQQALATLGAVGQQVTFETFGISLNVLPTITDSDSILMNVAAQTRDIDTANPFAAPGLPAFRTRKADTQVEMDPSQVLVIGGLINSSSTNNLSKIPFLGDIPILGLLARSKEFSRGDSELVIVLSPEIVRGGHASQIIRPLALDASPRPGEFDYIPRTIDLSRTSVPIAAPPNMQARDPVDLQRPATVNDLDHIYK